MSDTSLPSPQPVFHIGSVRVSFGSHTALDDVSLRVAPNERVALIGPSGAGKSTLLRLCTGAVTPAAGQVQVLGHNLAHASSRELRGVRANVGTVYQQLHLVEPLSALKNVLAGNLGRWGTVKALFCLAKPAPRQLSPAAQHHRDISDLDQRAALEAMQLLGVDHLARTRTGLLSGGEQQRVALARVLVQKPRLILADEPIAALDPERARSVMRLLGTVVEETGAALIVSLHDPDIAVQCVDRVVGLRNGRIIFDAPAHEVTKEQRAELYRIA